MVALYAVFALLALQSHPPDTAGGDLKLIDLEYFETRGLNILVFSNRYSDLFSDSKMGGIEIIHHGVRTATNGDIRLSPTPEQWDPIPDIVERRVDRQAGDITMSLRYPEYNFA